MDFFKDLKVGYEAGKKIAYSVRKSKLENEYWHQEIAVSHIKDIGSKKLTDIGLVGYVCDTGISIRYALHETWLRDKFIMV